MFCGPGVCVLAQLDVSREQTDDVLRDKQLVSGKVISGIHNLYMRCKLSMRGPQKVRGCRLLVMAVAFLVHNRCDSSESGSSLQSLSHSSSSSPVPSLYPRLFLFSRPPPPHA